MKPCKLGPNEYHLQPRAKIELTIYDCQCKVANKISGSFSWSLYKDMEDLKGLNEAKEAWWEVYLWFKEQERLQDE